MYRARLVARNASRFSDAVLRQPRSTVNSSLLSRRVDFISQRSYLPVSFRGVSVLRSHSFTAQRQYEHDFSPIADSVPSLIFSTSPGNETVTKALSGLNPIRRPQRTQLSGRIGAGIYKKRSVRAYSTHGSGNHKGSSHSKAPVQAAPAAHAMPSAHSDTSSDSAHATLKSTKAPSTKSNGRITWREGLKSPMKALRYSNQLRRDFVNWLKHIWAGAKLLAADVRVSSGILRRIVNGKQISRRERNFIVQTGVDLARLVPFSLFLIVPLAEFALPFALRFFPNMLPSQFQDEMKKTEDMKKQLKGRLEIAKYLREVVEEKAKIIKSSSEDSELQQDAESLENFIDAIRSGEPVDSAEVSKFARLFSDEITIDGAARPQLVAMCKYMGLTPYGHDQFLRFKLRSRLNTIKNDDMQIMWEGGANSLTDEEIIKACQDRGIRSDQVPKKELRKQLNDWLDLSQKNEIPSSLMIMSRAFFYTGADGIKETLGSLPEVVIMDVKQAAAGNQDRLEEARRQAKLIAIESEVEERIEREEEERRKKKEEELSSIVDEVADGSDKVSEKEVMAAVEAREAKIIEDVFGVSMSDGEEKSPAASDSGSEPAAPTTAADEEEHQKEQEGIRRLLVSLGELASESAVEQERKELQLLKSELAGAEALVKESGESAGSELRRFKSVVKKLEREVEKVDAVVGLRMKLLDKDNDGVMSFEELKSIMGVIAGNPDDDLVSETLHRLDADADGNISKADLGRLLKELQGESSLDK